jgi:ADP-ribosyl-[dinitrogen reductase] hydrolase
MRLAPVVLAAHGHLDRVIEWARSQSRTAHGAPQAVDACAFFAELLLDAIAGARRAVLEPRPISGHPAIETIAQGSWRAKPRNAISSKGYVVFTLEAAL